eukprot:1196009-Prorocentrum_minimum.AAC.4
MQEAQVYSHDRPIRNRKPYSRARRGHCRIDLVKLSYHRRIRFSRQFFTDAVYVRVEPYSTIPVDRRFVVLEAGALTSTSLLGSSVDTIGLLAPAQDATNGSATPAHLTSRRYCVDVKGYGVDVKGYGVNVKGYDVDVKGYGVNVKGCCVDVKGYCAAAPLTEPDRN